VGCAVDGFQQPTGLKQPVVVNGLSKKLLAGR
jgi:hypothetical protein